MFRRFLFFFLLCALVASFSALNWSAIAAQTPISLGFMSIEAPLGLVLLTLSVLELLVFVVYMAIWQGQILKESRRQHNELKEQRALVDKAEASRATELRATMLAEFQRLTLQLKQSEATSSRELHEHTNSLAAMIGEMDERSKSKDIHV